MCLHNNLLSSQYLRLNAGRFAWYAYRDGQDVLCILTFSRRHSMLEAETTPDIIFAIIRGHTRRRLAGEGS